MEGEVEVVEFYNSFRDQIADKNNGEVVDAWVCDDYFNNNDDGNDVDNNLGSKNNFELVLEILIIYVDNLVFVIKNILVNNIM